MSGRAVNGTTHVAAVAAAMLCVGCDGGSLAGGLVDAGAGDAGLADAGATEMAPSDTGAADASSDDGGVILVHPPISPACFDDGWCWSTPLPAADMLAVWSGGDDDMWVAGKNGAAYHWQGSRWAATPIDTSGDAVALAGASGSHLWSAGTDGIHHFDGSAWVHQIVGMPCRSLWASGATNVWAACDGGVLRWDGSAWTVMRLERALVVTGSSSTNVWVLLGDLSLMGWNDGSWSVPRAVPPGPLPQLLSPALWTGGADDVWVVGSRYMGGLLRELFATHWDGQTFITSDFNRAMADDVQAIWGSASNDVWLNDGSRLYSSTSKLRHWDGQAWSQPSSGNGYTGTTFARGPQDVWLIDPVYGLSHFDGHGWWPPSRQPVPHRFPDSFSSPPRVFHPGGLAIWGSAVNDVWIDRSHWDGHRWAPGGCGDSGDLNDQWWCAIWGGSAQDVWTSTTADSLVGRLMHRPGHLDADLIDESGYYVSIWGSGSTDVWFLGGFNARGAHWDGVAVERFTLPATATPDMHQVWGAAADDVWAVGDELFHWDGRAWSAVASPTSAPFRGIWGAAREDVWAATDAGLAHWNGSGWALDPASAEPLLNGVWGFAADDVWVGGGRHDGSGVAPGIILHWDGSSWRRSGVDGRLAPVGQFWGANPRDLWATVNGGVLRRQLPAQ